MPSRRPARLMAPLALVAAAVAVVLVVHSSGSGSPGSSSPASAPSTRTAGHSTPSLTSRPPRRTYTVKAGDTLSAIAQETGVSLSRIEALNPHVDAGALRTGQKLKLAP